MKISFSLSYENREIQGQNRRENWPPLFSILYLSEINLHVGISMLWITLKFVHRTVLRILKRAVI